MAGGYLSTISYGWSSLGDYLDSIFGYCSDLVIHVLENGEAYADAAISAAGTSTGISLVSYSPDQYIEDSAYPIDTDFKNVYVNASVSDTLPEVRENVVDQIKTLTFLYGLNFSNLDLPTFNNTNSTILDLNLDAVDIDFIENNNVASYSFNINDFSKTLFGERPSDYEISNMQFPTFTFPSFSIENIVPYATNLTFPSFVFNKPNWTTDFKKVTDINVNSLNSIVISNVSTNIENLNFIAPPSTNNINVVIDTPDFSLPDVNEINNLPELPDIEDIGDISEDLENFNINNFKNIFDLTNILNEKLTWEEPNNNLFNQNNTLVFEKRFIVNIQNFVRNLFEAAKYESDNAKSMYWFSDFRNLLETYQPLWNKNRFDFSVKIPKTTNFDSSQVIQNWWKKSIPQKIKQAWQFEAQHQLYVDQSKYNELVSIYADEYMYFILQLKNTFTQWWTHKISQFLSTQEYQAITVKNLEYENLLNYYEVALPYNNLYYQLNLLPFLLKQLSFNFKLLQVQRNSLITEAQKLKYLYNQGLVQKYKLEVNNINLLLSKQKYNYEKALLLYKHIKTKIEQNILKEQYNAVVMRLWATYVSTLVQQTGVEELKIASTLEKISQKLLEIERFGLKVQKAQLNSDIMYFNKVYEYYIQDIDLNKELLQISKGVVESKNFDNQLILDNALLTARQAQLSLQRAALQADSIDVQKSISEYQAYDLLISNKAQASLNLIDAKVSNYRDVNQILSSYISFLHQVMSSKINVYKNKYALDQANLQTYNIVAQIEALKTEYYDTYLKRMVNYAQVGKVNEVRAINRKNQAKITLFEAAYKKLAALIRQYASRINIVEGYGRIYQAIAQNYQQRESLKLEYDYLRRTFEDEVKKYKIQLYNSLYNYLAYKESVQVQRSAAEATLYNSIVDLMTKFNNTKYELEQSKLRMLQSYYNYQVNAARLSIEYGRTMDLGLLRKQRALAGFYAQVGNAFLTAASVGLSAKGGGSGQWSWTRSYSMNVSADSGYVNIFYKHA